MISLLPVQVVYSCRPKTAVNVIERTKQLQASELDTRLVCHNKVPVLVTMHYRTRVCGTGTGIL